MKDVENQKSVNVRNFHRVNEWLYRGGQPTAEGLRELKALGIRTIISFRWGQKAVAAERAACEVEGMEFISLPLNYWNLPTQKVIDQFLTIIDDVAKRPVYVHCLHGADRTGFLIAVYRMAREQWKLDEAYREMVACGFHRIRIRHFKWVLWHHAHKAHDHRGNFYRWL